MPELLKVNMCNSEGICQAKYIQDLHKCINTKIEIGGFDGEEFGEKCVYSQDYKGRCLFKKESENAGK